jgi:hypothetical protein
MRGDCSPMPDSFHTKVNIGGYAHLKVLPFAGFFFAAACLLRTSAFFAAFLLASLAATAFFALALRSSTVRFSQALLPPSFPPRAPCFLKNSNTSGF